jgi:flagellar assembly protein FliH
MPALIIPQEKLTAYQRWELAALHEDPSVYSSDGRSGSSEADKSLHAQNGYDAGYDAGYKIGSDAAEQQVQQIAKLFSSSSEALKAVEQKLAHEILDLAIEIARQVLRGELTVRREALLPVVCEAMGALPESATQRKLLLNPSDVDIVRSHLGEDIKLGGWQIIEDHLIEPGGCKIMAANGDIDATLANRWKRVVGSLDRSMAWHDE